jgi:hypothetical protein
MFVNDVLSRTLGLRVVRESMLRSSGIYALPEQSRRINDKAARVLDTIARHNGKVLTPALKRQADSYAVEILGDIEYAPWLRVYAAMRGKFLEGWMPENFYHLVVVPRIIKNLADLTAMKSFSNLLLKTEALPDIGYHIDGVFYDRDYRIITRAEMAALARPHGWVFVKGDGGGRGTNVRKVAAALLERHEFAGDCAIQRPIQPHAFFTQFGTGALATVRIITMKTPSGAIEQRGAGVRFGLAGTEWLVSEKSVSVIILDGEGRLDEWGYVTELRAIAAHPDTGTPFAGKRIPHYAEAVEFCKALHARQPHYAIIGWDVAINRDGGVELVEWNGGHGGITLPEAVTGPHFADMGWEKFARVRA